MPPKAQKEICYPITSEEHFLQLVNPENKKLLGKLIYSKKDIFSCRSSPIMVRTLHCHEH